MRKDKIENNTVLILFLTFYNIVFLSTYFTIPSSYIHLNIWCVMFTTSNARIELQKNYCFAQQAM